MPLQAVSKDTLYTQIMHRILDMITEDGYRPGDKLPSEREIAQKLEVGRPSVREALAGLQALGVVQTRIGYGTVVMDPASARDQQATLEEAAVQFARDESPYEIVAVRELLEAGAIEMAIERATEQDIEEVRVALERLLAALESPPGYSMELDFAFHLAVAKASHNTLLVRYMESIGQLVQQPLYLAMIAVLRRDPARAATQTRDHRLIYEALKERDKHKAIAGIRHHFAVWSLPEFDGGASVKT